MRERAWGAVFLAVLLWFMFATVYIFVFTLPQPLQVAAFFAAGIGGFVFTLDWLRDRRNP
jgi:Flp pilus assembly protein TadB